MGRRRVIQPQDYERFIIALRDQPTVADAAKALGVSRATLYNLLAAEPHLKYMAEAARAIAEGSKPLPERASHGNESRYAAGCRCEPCTEAATLARGARRARNERNERRMSGEQIPAPVGPSVYEIAGPPPLHGAMGAA